MGRSVVLTPVATAQPEEYSAGDDVYYVVSAKAVGYFEAAREKCESRSVLQILRLASKTDMCDEVRMNLYGYALFEFDVPREDLAGIFRPKVSSQIEFARQAQSIHARYKRYKLKQARSLQKAGR